MVITTINIKNLRVDVEEVLTTATYEVVQNGNSCTMSAKKIDVKLNNVSKIDLQGAPNIPAVQSAQSQILQQMPQKLAENNLKRMSPPHSIPCDLF